VFVRTLFLQPGRPISSEWFAVLLQAKGIHGKEGRGGAYHDPAPLKPLIWI
jgi:hypothetical protein